MSEYDILQLISALSIGPAFPLSSHVSYSFQARTLSFRVLCLPVYLSIHLFVPSVNNVSSVSSSVRPPPPMPW